MKETCRGFPGQSQSKLASFATVLRDMKEWSPRVLRDIYRTVATEPQREPKQKENNSKLLSTIHGKIYF